MTRIVYKPHCANCGALINDDVKFKKTIVERTIANKFFYPDKLYDISPYRCENCGEFFEAIEIKQPEYESEVI